MVCALDLDHSILHMLRAAEMPENNGYAEDMVSFTHDNVVYKVALRVGTTSFVRALRKAGVSVIIVTCNLVADKVMEALSRRCDVFEKLECHIIESRERGAKSLEMIGIDTSKVRVAIFDDSPNAWRNEDQDFVITAKKFDAKLLAPLLDEDDDDLLDKELDYMQRIKDDMIHFFTHSPAQVIDFTGPTPIRSSSPTTLGKTVQVTNTIDFVQSSSHDSSSTLRLSSATDNKRNAAPIIVSSPSLALPADGTNRITTTALSGNDEKNENKPIKYSAESKAHLILPSTSSHSSSKASSFPPSRPTQAQINTINPPKKRQKTSNTINPGHYGPASTFEHNSNTAKTIGHYGPASTSDNAPSIPPAPAPVVSTSSAISSLSTNTDSTSVVKRDGGRDKSALPLSNIMQANASRPPLLPSTAVSQQQQQRSSSGFVSSSSSMPSVPTTTSLQHSSAVSRQPVTTTMVTTTNPQLADPRRRPNLKPQQQQQQQFTAGMGGSGNFPPPPQPGSSMPMMPPSMPNGASSMPAPPIPPVPPAGFLNGAFPGRGPPSAMSPAPLSAPSPYFQQQNNNYYGMGGPTPPPLPPHLRQRAGRPPLPQQQIFQQQQPLPQPPLPPNQQQFYRGPGGQRPPPPPGSAAAAAAHRNNAMMAAGYYS